MASTCFDHQTSLHTSVQAFFQDYLIEGFDAVSGAGGSGTKFYMNNWNACINVLEKYLVNDLGNGAKLKASSKQFRLSDRLVFRIFYSCRFVADTDLYNRLTGELFILIMFFSENRIDDAHLASIVIALEIESRKGAPNRGIETIHVPTRVIDFPNDHFQRVTSVHTYINIRHQDYLVNTISDKEFDIHSWNSLLKKLGQSLRHDDGVSALKQQKMTERITNNVIYAIVDEDKCVYDYEPYKLVGNVISAHIIVD